MFLVTILEQFIRMNLNTELVIPFVLDDVTNVIVDIGYLDSSLQAVLKTDTGKIVHYDDIIHNTKLLFKNKKLRDGSYHLIINIDSAATGSERKIKIIAQSDLQMKINITPLTFNTNKQSLIQAKFYYKDYHAQIEDAKVSVKTSAGTVYTLKHQDDGLYSDLFPTELTQSIVLIDVYAKGIFGEKPFQRQHTQIVHPRNGQFLFTGPYNWEVVADLNKISFIKEVSLNFDVQVRQTAKYGVAATINDSSQKSIVFDGNEFLLKPGSYNLALAFDGQEILQCGKEPYKLIKLFSYLINDDDNECDALTETELKNIPLLYLQTL